MRLRTAFTLLLLVLFFPRPARADATLFFGTTTSPENRTVKGFAFGASILIVGFEFEYGSISEDAGENAPSLKTTSGNVLLQTIGIPFQLYFTTGGGIYKESLGPDEETSGAFNTGGGAKIRIAGPLRVRVDYRIFKLSGNPRHDKYHRLYAGVNLAF